MNQYQRAMDRCPVPEDLEARLRRGVLAETPAVRRRVLRPRSFGRRVLLAAALALALSFSVGAAVLVPWDALFADRFGSGAAELPVTESAFQQVQVTSQCGDVTLTVRQALSDATTVYLILDYRLPDTADRAAVETAWDGDTEQVDCPRVDYFATGDVTWADLEAQGDWSDVDWTAGNTDWLAPGGTLAAARFPGGATSQVETRGFDAATGTLTYLLRFTLQSGSRTLRDQPLTLLVTPPVLVTENGSAALADHPALVTFQPSSTASSLTGAAKDAAFSARVTLSPFAVTVTYTGGDYATVGQLREALSLVDRSGTVTAMGPLLQGLSGGESSSTADGAKRYTVRVSASFADIQDLSALRALRIGDRDVLLKPAA